MSPGNRNAVAKAHEFPKHLSPGYNRNTLFGGGKDFRVVPAHRVRDDDNISAVHIVSVMAKPDLRALLGQGPGCHRFHLIRPTDVVSLIDQH